MRKRITLLVAAFLLLFSITFSYNNSFHRKNIDIPFTDTQTEFVDFIKTKKCRASKVSLTKGSKIGHLSSEDLDISVDLYYSLKQSVVDDENKAFVSTYNPPIGFDTGFSVVGDHNFQEFSNLRYAKNGDRFFFEMDYGEFVYEVEKVMCGKVQRSSLENDILTDDGVSLIEDAYDTSKNKADVYLITCYPFENALQTDDRYVVKCKLLSGTKIF